MAEYIRSITVTVTVDTNKRTLRSTRHLESIGEITECDLAAMAEEVDPS